MNRLEREVLAEIETDYEFNEDKAVAIVALVREAVLQEIEDAKPDPEYAWYSQVNVMETSPISITSKYIDSYQKVLVTCECGWNGTFVAMGEWASRNIFDAVDYHGIAEHNIKNIGKYLR